jgi:hypothetical protein
MPKKGKNDMPKRKNENSAVIISKVDTSRTSSPAEPTGPARMVRDIIYPARNVQRGRRSSVKASPGTAVNDRHNSMATTHDGK